MKKHLFLLVLLFFTGVTASFSQATCNGSFGQPIVNITFGQGPNPGATLAAVVPGASTNYTYVAPTGNPAANIVLDGNYAIINSTPANPYWLQTGDHTNNGNGYMAFFNAAPNPGEFYRQQVSGLCSGTTYEFAAWIMNALDNSKAANTVPPNVTFKIYNPANLVTPLVAFSTGDILPTSTVIWRQYATLFTTPTGINSVILTLSNNNIGGSNSFGNDLAIDDITFRACGPLTTASFAQATALNTLTLCENAGFNLYGTVSSGLNNPACQWQISNDNGNSFTNINNATILNYAAAGLPLGTYKFRLISQETANINAPFCKFFSNIIDLTVTPLAVDAGADTSFCSNGTVVKKLAATGGTIFSWSPAALLNNPNIATPTATVNTTTKFYVTVSNSNGCSNIDSVTVFVKPLPALVSPGNSIICPDSTLSLSASGASSYNWGPGIYVADSLSANTVFTGTQYGSLYFMTVTGTNNGCAKTDSFQIFLKFKPLTQTIPDTSVCSQQSIELTTTGAGNYSWSPAFQLDNPNIASPIFRGNVSQKYYVKGTFAGCSTTDSVTITVKPTPTLVSSGNSIICADSALVLSASGANSFSWSPANLFTNTTAATTSFTGTQTTDVYVTGTSNGCSKTDTLTIVVKPLPQIQTIPDTTICKQQTITLTTTGAATYSWSPAFQLDNPNIASPNFTGNVSGKYYVKGFLAGCSTTDSVQITVGNKTPFLQPPNKTTCINKPVMLDGFNGSNVIYTWSPVANLDNPNVANPMATATSNTSFTVNVKENLCNTDTVFTVLLTVTALPGVTAAKSNDLDCTTAAAQLAATGAVTYSWTPAASLNNATTANPTATPAATTTYTVTGTDANGCSNTDSIKVLKTTTKNEIFIPNSFTPNNDGWNDCFKVLVKGTLQPIEFIIYNRWGEKVFSANNSGVCWDGKYKNQNAPAGNYVYFLKADTDCGLIIKKGNVLLIR